MGNIENEPELDVLDTFLLGEKVLDLIKKLLRGIKNVQKK